MALKILLADDSMTAQNMGKKILVDAGYEVVAVSNGAAAIKKISSERPDIAILDEYMPGYTGSEVCERVKASAETSKIPVLLTVGKMEPFDQEKANKVRADGVMIKPFEASDLIAAIQSIAQRLLAPTPPPRMMHDATVQLRAGHAGYEDTLRVPPPKAAEPSHEDTLRLTAEQIKAFQDASYKDWAATAERHLEDDEKVAAQEAVDEIPVTAAVAEEAAGESVIAEPAIAEPRVAQDEVAPAMPMVDADMPTSSRETPVFSAMAASGVAAEHEIFNSTATPIAPVEEPAPVFTAAPTFYTPPVVEPAEEPAAPAFAIQAVEPVSSVTEEPAVTEAPAIVEPIVEALPAAPAAVVPPVLETSAPLTPGPMPVEQAANLEPTIAPAEEVAVSQSHDLEITSPPQERGGPIIVQDAALVTESDDMSEFVTKFGVESAEPVHVGVVSDLSQEQIDAIVTPVEEEAPAAPETLTADVREEVAEVTPAVVEEPQVPATESVAVEQKIEAVEAPPPVVVQEPAVEDTQRIVAVPEAEPEPVARETEAVEIAEAPSTSVEISTVDAVTPTIEPSVMVAETPLPSSPELPAAVAEVVAPTIEAAETAAVAEGITESVQPAVESPISFAQVAEVGLAAAAGAAVIGMPHIGGLEPAGVEQPMTPEEPNVEKAAETEVVEPQPEPYGDAALAEELAAALSRKETEERAKSAANAAAAAALEPAAAAAIAPVRDMGMQGLSDTKLAEAVARAFENLKPQLITEIIKELGK